MLERAFYSVIAPEAAAVILYRDVTRAPDVAAALKLTASDLLRLGVIDGIVPEPPGGAHTDADAAAAMLRRHLVAALWDVCRLSRRRLLERRYRKYRQMGQVGGPWRELLRGLQDLLETVEHRLPRRGAAPEIKTAPGGPPGASPSRSQ
jgi:hypothetical protein